MRSVVWLAVGVERAFSSEADMPHTPHPRSRRLPAALQYEEDSGLQEPCTVPLLYTRHAVQRMQQRGISAGKVQIVVRDGREYHVGDGRLAFHLNRRAVVRARTAGRRVEGAQDISVILTADGIVVTVQHMDRVPKMWRAA